MTLSPFEEWIVKGLIGGLFLVVGYLISNFVYKRKQGNSDEPGQLSILMSKMDEILKELNELKVQISVITTNNSHVDKRMEEFHQRLNDHAKRLNTLEREHSKNHG